MKIKRGEVAVDNLIWWLLGAFLLVVSLLLIFGLREKSSGALAYIKDLFSFG